ncbi:MAG: DUF6288 domain-containing protein [Planctomycetota bacterium]
MSMNSSTGGTRYAGRALARGAAFLLACCVAMSCTQTRRRRARPRRAAAPATSGDRSASAERPVTEAPAAPTPPATRAAPEPEPEPKAGPAPEIAAPAPEMKTPASEVDFYYFNKNKAFKRFHVGVTGLYAICRKGRVLVVDGTEPGTPAHGKFEKGETIVGVNGERFEGNPFVALGTAITEAEAKGGKLEIMVERDGAGKRVALTIPVLGEYADTWPLECENSKKIIDRTAEYIVRSGILDKVGIGEELAAVFLLSTGDDKYLPIVAKHARMVAEKPVPRGGNTWNLGYQGIELGEYYLRMGDRSVLSGLKTLCDTAAAGQSLGGWCHGGLGTSNSGGYVQSGLVNATGTTVLIAVLLGAECGVGVDREMYDIAVTYFYRFAGHCSVPYGDHRPEVWPSCNGKNGMLACAMSLLGRGDAGHAYRIAAEHAALDMADSYPWLLCGHTGGGFDVIWRGLGSVHVPASKRASYRRHMDKLAWFYDISRLPGGGFSMVPGERYAGNIWGTGGVGLAYTAPLRTLRITGAPPTRHSKKVTLRRRPWGVDADDAFLGTDHCEGYGDDDLEPHEVYLKLDDKEIKDKALLARLIRHYNPVARTRAAKALAKAGGEDELVEGLHHDDARVRRAACDGISLLRNFFREGEQGLPKEVVSARCAAKLVELALGPRTAWWELDGVLQTIGRASAADIRKHYDILMKFARHEEWFLRDASFWGIVGLHSEIEPKEILDLADIFARETQPKARDNFNRGFTWLTKKDGVKLDRETLRAWSKKMAHSLHSPTVGQGLGDLAVHEAAHRTMMVFKGFDPVLYGMILDDIEKYLKIWNPTGQHSGWLMGGSRWQLGMLKVLEKLGPDGRPLCKAIKAVLRDYDRFEVGGRQKEQAAKLKEQMEKAVEAWEKKHGKVR